MTDEVEIRALRDDDDLEAQLDLSERAFGPRSGEDREYWYGLTRLTIRNGTSFGVFAGQRPVGGALFFNAQQWWCGRPVPMAGVAGVKIAPEDRGRGIGRRLMTSLLDEIADRGYPLSVLYPATMPIYRSLGWELAGRKYTLTISARYLRDLVTPEVDLGAVVPSPKIDIRRAGPTDARGVVDVIGRVHEAARDSGPITWDAEVVALNLGMTGRYNYLSDDGFTSYRWRDGGDSLFVGGVRAISAGTVRELWSIIASHGSVAETVHAWVGPADPVWWLPREWDAEVSRSMWMLRVVDAPAAIAARGFPAGVSATVSVTIEDPVRPANTGGWTLSVDGGKGELIPGARGDAAPLAVGARGLAALYAGTPVQSLRQVGLVAGGSADVDAALDAAFAAQPYMLDSF